MIHLLDIMSDIKVVQPDGVVERESTGTGTSEAEEKQWLALRGCLVFLFSVAANGYPINKYTSYCCLSDQVKGAKPNADRYMNHDRSGNSNIQISTGNQVAAQGDWASKPFFCRCMALPVVVKRC